MPVMGEAGLKHCAFAIERDDGDEVGRPKLPGFRTLTPDPPAGAIHVPGRKKDMEEREPEIADLAPYLSEKFHRTQKRFRGCADTLSSYLTDMTIRHSMAAAKRRRYDLLRIELPRAAILPIT